MNKPCMVEARCSALSSSTYGTQVDAPSLFLLRLKVGLDYIFMQIIKLCTVYKSARVSASVGISGDKNVHMREGTL